jgi:hypothetical protein
MDWIGMKYYQKRIILAPLFICIATYTIPIAAIPVMTYFMLSFSVNPFAVEEKGKLDNLYLTLPVKRSTIVRARFGLSFLMVAIGQIVGVLAAFTITALSNVFPPPFRYLMDLSFQNVFLFISVSLFMYAVLNLSMFPFLFKIGYARGKALGFYLPNIAVLVTFYVVFLLVHFNPSIGNALNQGFLWVLEHILMTSLLLLGAAVAFLLLSYRLSLMLYHKREF